MQLSQEELTLLLGGIDPTQTKARDWYHKTLSEHEKPKENLVINTQSLLVIIALLSTASKPLPDQDQSILEEIKPVVSEAVFETLNESIRRKEELLERLQRGNKLLRELRRLELLEKYGPSAVAGPPGARGRARFRKQREISHSNLVGCAFPCDW
jgi:hypothetical protein